jgi:hypothetical protein
LSGQQFGRILDLGGYRLGFTCLAALAAISAVLCLFLYEWAPAKALVGQPAETKTKTETEKASA